MRKTVDIAAKGEFVMLRFSGDDGFIVTLTEQQAFDIAAALAATADQLARRRRPVIRSQPGLLVIRSV
jgi:hypothetical protein